MLTIGNQSLILADEESALPIINTNSYSNVLKEWKTEGLKSDLAFSQSFLPSTFSVSSAAFSNDLKGYDLFVNEALDYIIDFSDEEAFEVEVEVLETGLYMFGFDYYSVNETIKDLQIQISINGFIQYHEASQITIKNFWETPNEFSVDRYKNDIMPTASLKSMWMNETFKDTQRLQEHPLLFKLDQGVNQIKITRTYGSFFVGKFYVSSLFKLKTYQEYLNTYNNKQTINSALFVSEAEMPNYRNDLAIKYATDKNAKVTPFALMENRLNIIDGGSYKKGGQALNYLFTVTQEGFYYITLKIKQEKSSSVSFRTLYINGQIPFAEAKEIMFKPQSKWSNFTLGNQTEKFKIYLKKGENNITLEVNASPFLKVYETVNEAMNTINNLGLSIKKLTGNNPSASRDWDIEENMPNLRSDLINMANQLDDAYDLFIEINQSKKSSEILVNLKKAKETIRYFSLNPNKIPKEINKFNVGNSSALQKLGLILPLIIEQPLTMDKLYVHGVDEKLPSPKVNFFYSLWIGIKRFFLSFFSDTYQDKVDKDELEVWVNRSRQYIHLMQQMVDDDFTRETGIKVKISIMPNEDKLILATSSNTQPDVALGVAGWRPYDFAIRNALVNLRELDGFYDVADRFKAGAFSQLIYQEGVYGIPETQNFLLLFYRKDILRSINIDIPNTWQEVLDILPELQRYGLNFYSPLSTSNAFKAYVNTMPFINQFDGILYTDDLLKSNLTNQNTINAINFMAELYTVYSLPVEVGSFYNQFRYGTLPLGIGDFGMYVQLLHAAPEIAGLWDIAPIPGIEKQGVIDRSFEGASTSGMIFKNSKKIDQAWAFLDWWTSKDVQFYYAENLISSMGPEYMWNTSNVEAFKDYSWEQSHKDVFLEQWEHIFDTPKTPASYMMEREISNIWSKVVYDGMQTRIAISDSAIIIDKEITKKMIEFKYINNKNEVLKSYLFPTRKTIDRWVRK